MSKKTLKTLEKEYGVMMKGDVNLDDRYDDEEFRTILIEKGDTYVGVNYQDRIEFLKKNGYAVTRENMVDSTLSANPIAPETVTE